MPKYIEIVSEVTKRTSDACMASCIHAPRTQSAHCSVIGVDAVPCLCKSAFLQFYCSILWTFSGHSAEKWHFNVTSPHGFHYTKFIPGWPEPQLATIHHAFLTADYVWHNGNCSKIIHPSTQSVLFEQQIEQYQQSKKTVVITRRCRW